MVKVCTLARGVAHFKPRCAMAAHLLEIDASEACRSGPGLRRSRASVTLATRASRRDAHEKLKYEDGDENVQSTRLTSRQETNTHVYTHTQRRNPVARFPRPLVVVGHIYLDTPVPPPSSSHAHDFTRDSLLLLIDAVESGSGQPQPPPPACAAARRRRSEEHAAVHDARAGGGGSRSLL